ncbi:hypothetical protein BCT86_14155 [Vibrio breoganii]|uniref:Lipoprotein n=3 Tax=Vibrio breoganii TaxID=553239 RepID=A0AAN0XYX0_9VIBR|nr:hypothetical protein [Vibrio breoganii]ANO35220.1 hypothetical protein A6E01_18790 [Vibrio breoganii]MDN3716851.1 hypothetical protein [Vibrio breoganii]OCH77737.1 hypothetical protein A6D95_05595 [Vibrio breoganii]PMI14809.1 hypothetical protein BCU49_02330 [Vibrio breoganii]PML05027.1 hypothetical protein BCT86_14155 [Vibrio breoganii]
MKKSLTLVALFSVAVITGCSSSEPTRAEQAKEKVQDVVEAYGYDPEYGNDAPVPPAENPIRDTEKIDEVKEAVQAAKDAIAINDGSFENDVPKENPTLQWKGELARTEGDGTKIYTISNNGVPVAEVEMKPDGTGTITITDPDNIRETKVIAEIVKLDGHNAYYVEGDAGNDYVIINGKPIKVDGERLQDMSAIDKQQLKRKAQRVKQKIQAHRISG